MSAGFEGFPTVRLASLSDHPSDLRHVTSLRQQWSASHGFVGDGGDVGNVWVDPAHRRRGVATTLLSAAIDWCRTRSFERIVLNPSEMSAALCLALGFRPADDLLRLDL